MRRFENERSDRACQVCPDRPERTEGRHVTGRCGVAAVMHQADTLAYRSITGCPRLQRTVGSANTGAVSRSLAVDSFEASVAWMWRGHTTRPRWFGFRQQYFSPMRRPSGFSTEWDLCEKGFFTPIAWFEERPATSTSTRTLHGLALTLQPWLDWTREGACLDGPVGSNFDSDGLRQTGRTASKRVAEQRLQPGLLTTHRAAPQAGRIHRIDQAAAGKR
jgi:hypothetical protein